MSNISFKGDEKMRKFIDFLRENEINKYIALPEIAVMGDTSSGKSSLLSALAQLQLPANDKITTRCPLRLRMEKSDVKRAEVGIKWNDASSYKDEAAWPLCKLGCWEDVCDKISEAQSLILERGQVEVAFDVVEVNVYGPECIDLTLIDLPGIVRTVAKNETKRLIEDIKNLIDTYLSNKRCVILAVQPANVDFHNSQIMADAREVDPETRRTIPVITKPDMIDKGAEGNVVHLLLGEHVDFEMGFHMVKCRGQQALNEGVSMEEGMRDEMRFFHTNDPWRGLDKELFGVVKLRTKLSKLQVRMIQESVPDIVKEIRDKRAVVAARLETLGSLITTDLERRNHYSQLVRSVTEVVSQTLEGQAAALREGDVTFLSKQHGLFTEFGEQVMGKRLANLDVISVGAEVLVPLADGSEERGVVKLVIPNRNEAKYAVLPSSEQSSLRGPHAALTFHAAHEIGKVVEHSGVFYMITVKGAAGATNSAGYSVPTFLASEITLDVSWLQKRISQNRTNALPCFLNASIFNSIVAEMVAEDWKPLCLDLLETCKTAHLDLVRRAVDQSVKSSRFPALTGMLHARAENVVLEAFAQAEKEADVGLESFPYTQNHYLFDTITKMRNVRLKHRILKMVAGKTSGVEAIIEAAFSNVEKMSMEEHVAHEMQIVLNAYGKVAVKRVIDHVPMVIQDRSRVLRDALERALQVTDEELGGLMAEDERTVRRVKQDTEEKRKLDLAIRKLEELRMF